MLFKLTNLIAVISFKWQQTMQITAAVSVSQCDLPLSRSTIVKGYLQRMFPSRNDEAPKLLH